MKMMSAAFSINFFTFFSFKLEAIGVILQITKEGHNLKYNAGP
jgi:hypothetical protein